MIQSNHDSDEDDSRIKKPRSEFVLNENGFSLNKTHNRQDYAEFFSTRDIYQGWIGNCHYIAAIMGLTRNPDLLVRIVPPDNCVRKYFGLFHFRFWRLGHWHDVLVDDCLPTNSRNNRLLFSYNKLYPNEFWVPLFEKSFAKFENSNMLTFFSSLFFDC